MKRKIVSVWEVNQYTKSLLEEDYTLNDLWIQGEVSNCKYHHTGHIYFSIKDARAGINAVMFDRDASRLTFRLAEGMKIYARVRVTLYEKTGAYQAYVFDIEKQGTGTLYEAFERLKLQLGQEGLFDAAHKKPLPAFPKHIGVITSRTGAAVQDIIRVAASRNPSIPLTIYPTLVQGTTASTEIVNALKLANQEKRVDVIILGRGGGSIEDLWAFNEESVARAIFDSEIPVVSAVGHEVDFTISDFVSDVRAATPSQAAEIVVPSKAALQTQLQQYEKMLKMHISEKTKTARKALESLVSRPVFVQKDTFYKTKMQEVDEHVQKLTYMYQALYTKYERRYALATHNLERLSPLGTLKRGYSLAMKDQKVIKSVEALYPGALFELTVTDGTVRAKVCEKEL